MTEIQENSVRISKTGMQQMFLSIFLMICEQKLHQSTSSREESKVCYMLFCIAIYYYKSLQFEGFGS
jgi:hypothetical protein